MKQHPEKRVPKGCQSLLFAFSNSRVFSWGAVYILLKILHLPLLIYVLALKPHTERLKVECSVTLSMREDAAQTHLALIFKSEGCGSRFSLIDWFKTAFFF